MQQTAVLYQPAQSTGLIQPEEVDEEVEAFQVEEEPGVEDLLLLPLPPRQILRPTCLLAPGLEKPAELDPRWTSGLTSSTAQTEVELCVDISRLQTAFGDQLHQMDASPW